MKKWIWILLCILSIVLVIFLIVKNQDSDWTLENDLF